MLADNKREIAIALGILHKQADAALRATFIVDHKNTIRWTKVDNLSVGRNVNEVMRVLDAIQTDAICPSPDRKAKKRRKCLQRGLRQTAAESTLAF